MSRAKRIRFSSSQHSERLPSANTRSGGRSLRQMGITLKAPRRKSTAIRRTSRLGGWPVIGVSSVPGTWLDGEGCQQADRIGMGRVLPSTAAG